MVYIVCVLYIAHEDVGTKAIYYRIDREFCARAMTMTMVK